MYIGPEILPALTFWRLNAEEEGPSGILGCVYTVCSQLLFLDFLWSSAIHMSIIDKTFDCLLWNLVSSQITLPCFATCCVTKSTTSIIMPSLSHYLTPSEETKVFNICHWAGVKH